MRHGGVCRRRYDSLEWPRLQACQAGFGQGERDGPNSARRAEHSRVPAESRPMTIWASSPTACALTPPGFAVPTGSERLNAFERRHSQSAAGQRFAVRGGQSLPVCSIGNTSAIGITSAAKHSVPLGRSGTPHGILATHAECRQANDPEGRLIGAGLPSPDRMHNAPEALFPGRKLAVVDISLSQCARRTATPTLREIGD